MKNNYSKKSQSRLCQKKSENVYVSFGGKKSQNMSYVMEAKNNKYQVERCSKKFKLGCVK